VSLKKYAVGALAAAALAAPATAAAEVGPNGPDPTISTLRANYGTYQVDRAAASASPGFGSGTVYSPQGAPGEKFPEIAIIPGFTESESAVTWMGNRLASRGFVVITIQPNNVLEWPEPRGGELLAALDWLATSPQTSAIVDSSRQAVIGHSMGGGGTFEAARRRPSLKAAIGLQPWSTTGYKSNTVPQLIVSAEYDIIAPNDSHSNKLYVNTPATTPKYQIVVKGKDHFLGTQVNVAELAFEIAWLQRFVQGDTRYNQFLCPLPSAAPNGSLSGFRNNCATFAQ
jgi:predicted dienelactone hydrolase